MLRRTCLDLHMQIEVWEGTHKTNFEKFVGTGNLLDAGTHDAITREGVVEELEGIGARIRARWPGVGVVVRGDSGCCRDELMKWCEEEEVEYVLGLSKNVRLTKMIAEEMDEAKRLHEASGEAQRLFKELRYRTRNAGRFARRC